MILYVICEMPLHREQQLFCRVVDIFKLRISPSIVKQWLCSPTCENFKIDQQTCFLSFMYLHLAVFSLSMMNNIYVSLLDFDGL